MKKPKTRISYKTGDVILLVQDAFTKEQGYQIYQRLKKPVIMVPSIGDFSSISKKDLEAVLRKISRKE